MVSMIDALILLALLASLARSAVLYIWVTPEESRRKNAARARPDAQGSILYHRVHLGVMLGEYGRDDMDYLLETSGEAHVLRVDRGKKTFALKVARLDNRTDATSFVREAASTRSKGDVERLHDGLSKACRVLAEA